MTKIVLNVSSEESLLATRAAILQNMGYNVLSATNLPQVEHACKHKKIAAVIVGHSLPRNEKQRIITTVRDRCPAGTPVIGLYRSSPDEVAGTDEAISAQDGPEALVAALRRRV
jgi:DNA-binding response OmpR family regulator